MIKSNMEKERHTIPRWNSIYMAEKLGEQSSSIVKNEHREIVPKSYLKTLLDDWENERNLLLAIEIISNARLSNSSENLSDILEYAKHEILYLENVPDLLREYLAPSDREKRKVFPATTHQDLISKIKQQLNKYPNNSLMWVELSREYTILGQYEKAKKSIHTAYGLSPENRTVLRAIARYYTHLSEQDKALFYLRKSTLVDMDPWVLAAEISISNLIGKSSKKIKRAQQIIDSNNYSPLSISELASELGTMEFASGNFKLGKRRLKSATIDPFENAVAQIAWINESVCNITNIIGTIPITIECNYEAQMRFCIQRQDWENAQKCAGLWQEYQPFSHDAALISSFISSDYLQDYDTAKKSIECGLNSNPDNVDLLNNYIYALVLNNELETAKTKYRCAVSLDQKKESISLIATGGLLNYRQGNPEKGREMYLEAIDHFKKANDNELAFRAILCYAREEKLIGNQITDLLKEINDSKNNAYKKQYETVIHNYHLLD